MKRALVYYSTFQLKLDNTAPFLHPCQKTVILGLAMDKRTETKRTTVYLDEETARALRVKAKGNKTSVSSLVNEAVKRSLAEDAEDLEGIEEIEKEPDIPFEDVVKDLKKRGKI